MQTHIIREKATSLSNKKHTPDEIDLTYENLNERHFPVPNVEDSQLHYFHRPKSKDLRLFFKFHPHQNTKGTVIQKTFDRERGIRRQSLTYNEQGKCLYCSICLAFAKTTDSSVFITGFMDRRHIHLRVKEQENSSLHMTCAC